MESSARGPVTRKKKKSYPWRFMAEVLCPLPTDERWIEYKKNLVLEEKKIV